MSSNKPLTKDDLIDTLAEFYGGRLKPDFDNLGNRLDGVEGRLDGVEGRLDGVEGRLDGVENRLTGVENRLGKVEVELKYVKDEVKGLKSEFSTSVPKSEFNKLKARVDRYHPSN